MRQIARVLGVNDDKAVLEVVRTSACGGNCGSCKGSCETVEERITLPVEEEYSPGDLVELETSFRNFITYVFLVYGIPAILFVVAIALGQKFLPFQGMKKEVYSFLMGVMVAAGFYLLVLSPLDKKMKSTSLMRVVRKVK